jgi:hypothetical protein
MISVALAAIALCSIQASRFYIVYDAGLYHFQAIEWLTREPLVFGLANLHGRLGFNSAWLIILALFRLPGTDGVGMMLGSSAAAVFAIIALTQPLLSTSTWRERPMSVAFCVFAFVLLTWQVFRWVGFQAWTSTDHIPILLWVVIPHIFLRFSERHSRNEVAAGELSLLWLLSAFAVVSKMSTVPILLLPLAASVSWLKRKHPVRVLIVAMAMAGMLCSVWAVRSVVLSGCIVYPAEQTCLYFLPWSVPKTNVAQEHGNIISWARQPWRNQQERSKALHEWEWIRTWVRHEWQGRFLFDTVSRGLAVTLFLWFAWRLVLHGFRMPQLTEKKLARTRWRGLWVVFATTLGAAVFWFLSAPDPRFALGLFLTLISLPATALLSADIARSPSWLLRAGWIMVVVVFLWQVKSFAPWQMPLFAIKAETKIPSINYRNFEISNVTITVPAKGDQCWLAPIPCTPYPRRDLEMRRFRQFVAFLYPES